MRMRPELSMLALVLITAACTSKDAAPTDSAAGPAAGQVVSGAEPTANDISNYKLDMDKMRRYAATIKGFQNLSASDSAAAEAMSTGANESTAQMIAKLERNPIVMRVLRDNGLSARDYVWITAAWLQAAMTQGILESSPEAKMPEGQNPQNVEFLEANRAAIEGMMRDAGMGQ